MEWDGTAFGWSALAWKCGDERAGSAHVYGDIMSKVTRLADACIENAVACPGCEAPKGSACRNYMNQQIRPHPSRRRAFRGYASIDQGTWPADCVQRAFVEGAKWWQFKANGATAFPSEIDEMEAEAVNRYGEPAVDAQHTAETGR